jgi:hypothetical protein
MQVDGPRVAAADEFVFSVRTRADGACVVRGRGPSFEFEAMSPEFVEAQAMADRWRDWVREVVRG